MRVRAAGRGGGAGELKCHGGNTCETELVKEADALKGTT
jgi:hypothetical protein